jgi:dTDP-4-dehydrorhamnose reductase
MSKKSILLIGKGFLGNAIFEEATRKNFQIIGTNYSNISNSTKLDITNIHSLENLIGKINPDYIINLASINDINYLEQNEKIANSINTRGPKNIAKIAQEKGIRFFHISTDSIFDGKTGNYSEVDTPKPINVYSSSKFQGELEIQKYNNNHIILRTNFYGFDLRDRYFFNWILKNFKEKNKIIGFDDVIFTPLDVKTLSKMIIELFDIRFKGILNLSSDKPVSKFEFILTSAKFCKIPESKIICGKQDDLKMIAKRPKNTSLDNSLAKKLLKNSPVKLSDWLHTNREIISKYLK